MKVYEQLLNIIQTVIDSDKFPLENEEAKHYYHEGLKAAKQIIESEQDFAYEYAYEQLEEIVESMLEMGALEPEEIKDIIHDAIKKYEEK